MTEEAPGYASFADLMADDRRDGPAAVVGRPGRAGAEAAGAERRSGAKWDAEAVACGDLIGVDQWEPFPADQAPFKEPAELADIDGEGLDRRCSPRRLVGEPMEVNALSSWTYEVRYSRGSTCS